MNIEKIYQIDLNLLRLFAEVYDCGSVSVVPLTGAEVIGNGNAPSTKR